MEPSNRRSASTVQAIICLQASQAHGRRDAESIKERTSGRKRTRRAKHARAQIKQMLKRFGWRACWAGTKGFGQTETFGWRESRWMSSTMSLSHETPSALKETSS